MTKQIDELMALAGEYARCNATATAMGAGAAKDKLQQALEAALKHPLPDDLYDSKDWRAGSYSERVEWLHFMYESVKQDVERIEAALKPGEPVAWRLWDDEPGGVPAWRYYDQSDFRIGVNPHDFFDSLVPLYTAPTAQTPDAKSEYEADVWHEGSQSFYRAKILHKLTPEEVDAAPTAQTQKGLFVDLIAQHPGLAEELKAIDDMPMPTWTPPPRLKDTAVEACIKAVEDAFAWTGGHGEPSKPGADAIANIIRSHFHVVQTPPPQLTDDAIAELFYVESLRDLSFARAIETAVRAQFGVTNE